MPARRRREDWLPASYNPARKILFVPLVESCMDLTPVRSRAGAASLSTGVRWSLRPRPDSDGKGRREAINLETRRSVWISDAARPADQARSRRRGRCVRRVLDRSFARLIDETGKELWRTRLADVPSSAPISYLANGRQYVAMIVGNGGRQALTFPALVPEIRNPPDRGASVWVFELPGR